MTTPSINIRDILVAETDLIFKDDLHVGREPTKPNNVTTIFDTPNSGPQLTTKKNTSKNTDRYDYTAVQARVRNKSYEKAMALAWEIVAVLHNRGNEVVNDTKVTLIEALDSPALLDWDDNDRARVVVNFAVQQTSAD